MFYLKTVSYAIPLFVILVSVSSEYNLTIVHINDFHSHWFEFNEYERICNEEESNSGKCFGGFPRLLTLVRGIRKKEKNVLVLSSGEFFYGRSHNSLHGWKLAKALLPKLELDAMSLSNHDFGRGILELSAFLYNMKFPVLCANMWARNSSFLYSRVNKSAVLDVGGEKIGIIGFLHPDVLNKSRNAVSVKFSPEIPAIKEEVDSLVKEGVNKIIALGHSGYYIDLEIAKQVKEVDIVIGGNSDIILEKPTDDYGQTPTEGNIYKNYPYRHHHEVEAKSERVNKTLVLHIPQYGKYVGLLKATFDEHGKIIHESGEPIILDKTIPQDQSTLEFLRNASVTLEGLVEDYRMPSKEETLAIAESNLDGRSRNCRMRECSLGNLVADAMLYMYDKNENQPDWSHVDAVVINSGMIRYSIQSGNITFGDLTHALFLGDVMIRTHMLGLDVKAMMEHAVEKYDTTGVTSPGEFLQVSGLKVKYDVSQPPGNRIRLLQIRCKNCDSGYVPIKSYKNYYIGMPGFIQNGGDGYKRSLMADEDDPGQAEFLLLVDYLRKIDSVRPKLDGRISFVDEKQNSQHLSSNEQSIGITMTSTPTSFSSFDDNMRDHHSEKKKKESISPRNSIVEQTRKEKFSNNSHRKVELDAITVQKSSEENRNNLGDEFKNVQSFNFQTKSLKPTLEETIVSSKYSSLKENKRKDKYHDHVVRNESYHWKSKVNALGDTFKLTNETSESKGSALNLDQFGSRNRAGSGVNISKQISLTEVSTKQNILLELGKKEERPISYHLEDVLSMNNDENENSIPTQNVLPEGSVLGKNFEPSLLFQIANSSFGSLERTLLEAVISETNLNSTLLSEKAIEVLGESLKTNLKKFVQARTQVLPTSSMDVLYPESSNLSDSNKKSDVLSDELIHGKNDFQTLHFVGEKQAAEEKATEKLDSYIPTKNAKPESSTVFLSESDLKDVETVQDMLVDSVVMSILEKVKRKLYNEGKQNKNSVPNNARIYAREVQQNNTEIVNETNTTTGVAHRILSRTLGGFEDPSTSEITSGLSDVRKVIETSPENQIAHQEEVSSYTIPNSSQKVDSEGILNSEIVLTLPEDSQDLEKSNESMSLNDAWYI